MTMDKDNIELPPLPGEYYSFSKGEVHEYGRECYEAGLADERERREAAEAALGEVVDCNNSDPILISREPGYRWYDVIEQATAHFARYKD